MHILVTGGTGFLGRRLIEYWLKTGVHDGDRRTAAFRVSVLDVVRGVPFDDPRVDVHVGDLAALLADTAGLEDTRLIVHLAAVVSGEAEADFDRGMHVNLDGTRALLDWCRSLPDPPRLLFSSSVAVFGGKLPRVVQDDTLPTPQGSYGIQKFIGEQLVADYSRKGFIDGRSVRLPTIVVRPGMPNRAASSFASSIVREPAAGVATVCPVAPDAGLWILSPDLAVAALDRALALPAATWGSRLALNLAGLTATVDDLLTALARHAGSAARAQVRFERDPAIERLVTSWPARFNTARALALGFQADASADAIVRQHLTSIGTV